MKVGSLRVTHPFAALLALPLAGSDFLARLACVRRAASVHPEPGSYSLVIILKGCLLCYPLLKEQSHY